MDLLLLLLALPALLLPACKCGRSCGAGGWRCLLRAAACWRCWPQVGTDTLRGISRLDQAWIATLADKLEVSLEGYTKPGVGFTKAAKA
jgi:hypothetical protein